MSDHHDVVADNENDPGEKTLRSYVTGFLLCLVFTFIPFALVGYRMMSAKWLYISITVCAIIQLFVQVTFFLRLNASPKGRWSLIAFLFAIFVVLVLVFGSLWIMYNLNYYMVH